MVKVADGAGAGTGDDAGAEAGGGVDVDGAVGPEPPPQWSETAREATAPTTIRARAVVRMTTG